MLDLVTGNILIPQLGSRGPVHVCFLGALRREPREVSISQTVPTQGIGVRAGDGREVAAGPVLRKLPVYVQRRRICRFLTMAMCNSHSCRPENAPLLQ